MIVVLLIGLGLIFGSFVNAFIWRLHAKKDWVKERSECLKCHHVLAPKDLIPVVSFLLLRGKCRYCHKPIDDTPVSELLTPALFVLSYVAWPFALNGAGLLWFVAWLVTLVIFVALALYDLKWFLLPNKVVFPLVIFVALSLLARVFIFNESLRVLADAVLGAAAISGLFYALFLLSDGTWIGGGDVKLGLALGLLAGTPLKALLILSVASISGLLLMLPALLIGKAGRKTHIPFGPFLILGTIVVVLWGQRLIDWYAGILV